MVSALIPIEIKIPNRGTFAAHLILGSFQRFSEGRKIYKIRLI